MYIYVYVYRYIKCIFMGWRPGTREPGLGCVRQGRWAGRLGKATAAAAAGPGGPPGPQEPGRPQSGLGAGICKESQSNPQFIKKQTSHDQHYRSLPCYQLNPIDSSGRRNNLRKGKIQRIQYKETANGRDGNPAPYHTPFQPQHQK